MPENIDVELLKTLISRRDLCRALLQQSQRQRSLIAADDYTQILEVIARKQNLLEQWDELRRRQPDLGGVWRRRRPHLPAGVREECERLLAEIETLYTQLLKEEQDSTDFLTERRDSAQRRLQEISNGARVHQAYRDGLAPSTHRHLNVDQ